MRSTINKIAGVLITFFLHQLCVETRAQPASVFLDHYTTDDGLSNNTVWGICKSKFGYLWLGTQDGLNRFDGKNFKVFRYSAKDSNSLSNNTIFEILEDEYGYLWVGTFSGLNRYNPATNSFTRIKAGNYLQQKVPNVGIGAIAKSVKGNTIWVGSRGLFLVNQKTLSLEPAPGKLNEEIFPHANITSLLVGSDERIWIGSNAGLILYNPGDSSYQVFYSEYKSLLPGRRDYYINGMLLDERGKLWLASWGLGLLEFDTTQKKFTGQYLPEKSDGFKGGTNIIYNITRTHFPGEENIIWLAGNDSWSAFNRQTKKFSYYKTSVTESRHGVYGHTYSLFFDNAEGLWVGSEKGLYRYDRRLQVFNTHPFRYNFENACLNKVFDGYTDPADPTGNTVWIGTWSCGLFKYNLSNREFSEIPGWMKSHFPAGLIYYSIYRDKKGLLWVGSNNLGLMGIDENKKIVTHFYPPDNNPTSVRTVTKVIEDKAGNLWLATPAGIYRLDEARKLFHKIEWKEPDSIWKKFSISIVDICEDNKGNIWFTAQDGFKEKVPVVGKINNGGLIATAMYHQQDDGTSFPDIGVINNIICDQDNRIWCAGWNGLVNWDADPSKPVFEILTTEDGLANNFIYQVEKDNLGNIWCGTQSGLSVYIPREKKFRNFNSAAIAKDNIDGIFFNPVQRMLIIADWGKLHSLQTGEVLSAVTTPKVTISDFRVFDKPAPEPGKQLFDSGFVSLAHNRNVVTIDFAALTFYHPSQVKYAYKMEGVDKDWIFTANSSVTYNLNTGSYTFYVKAVNAEGVWNEKGTSMRIIIRSPFWKKWWFISIIIVAIAGVLYSIYRNRINQLKKLQSMRNNISQNLHDDIGSSLSNINILNELAKRNAANPEKSKEYLDKSGEDIQRISESLSDIVWNINPRYDDLQNLFIRMKRYAADMLDGKNINGQFDFPANEPGFSLSMVKRRDFYLVFKEAVNNLAKYSRAKNAIIRVAADGHHIELTVQDDGIGFDKNNIKSGNGLQNMEQRAIASGGQLSVSAKPGAGTTVRLKMRIG